MRTSAIFAIFSLAVGVVPSFARPSRYPRGDHVPSNSDKDRSPSVIAYGALLRGPVTKELREKNCKRNMDAAEHKKLLQSSQSSDGKAQRTSATHRNRHEEYPATPLERYITIEEDKIGQRSAQNKESALRDEIASIYEGDVHGRGRSPVE
ncbi:hypothetical protein F5148DRAFT_1150866 [Russula earlei]|uniref:Uncharacterized protein n=1 Tax=Russula earlei TaxID=71964 RepID=A0ACC0U2F4_9AGAM|nr:hypothetical protein F5148DRAFT_1150866 [Russula earlei]